MSIDEAHLEQICKVLADTATGLTGSEIGTLLQRLEIADPNPSATKRVRLYDALFIRQRRDACGNNVMAFIHEAMKPVRYQAAPEFFAVKREELNVVLAFCGYALGEDGRVSQKSRATTPAEAEQRARRLERKLRERGVHADVLKFCRAELVQENYFHAVFEATKSVADKLRDLTGLTGDGAELVDSALAGETPALAINTLQSQTERSEQRGFVNLLRGMFGTFGAVGDNMYLFRIQLSILRPTAGLTHRRSPTPAIDPLSQRNQRIGG